MHDKELAFTDGEVLKTIYNPDQIKRYIILKSHKDYITYRYEELRPYDEEELQ